MRLAVITAVPAASAVKSVRIGMHPMPGMCPQPGGGVSSVDLPSCCSTRGTELPRTVQ